MSGGDKTKKIESYGYNFRSLWAVLAYEMQHNFLHRKSGALPL